MSKSARGAQIKRAVRRTATSAAAPVAAVDALEQRVIAFAEHLGAMVGTVHAKADGWLDRDALTAQVATVRDAAAGLLAHLGAPGPAAKAVEAPARARRSGGGRSGGRVDAPGKKHRAPQKSTGAARVATTQAAKVRAARPMAKTGRRRGRG